MNKQTSSDLNSSEDSGRSRETNNEDIEDDEDPRPAKRRRLRSGAAYEAGWKIRSVRHGKKRGGRKRG
jgi:hypothetical protein